MRVRLRSSKKWSEAVRVSHSLSCLFGVSTVVRQRFTASSQHLCSFFTKSCSLLAASSQPLRSLFAAPCQPSGVLLSLAKNYYGAECQPPLINHRLWAASFASLRSSWLSAISHCIFNEESLQWSIFMQFIRKHTEHFRALSFEASSSQFSLCCRLTQWSADAWWSPAFEKVLKSFKEMLFWRIAATKEAFVHYLISATASSRSRPATEAKTKNQND